MNDMAVPGTFVNCMSTSMMPPRRMSGKWIPTAENVVVLGFWPPRLRKRVVTNMISLPSLVGGSCLLTRYGETQANSG